MPSNQLHNRHSNNSRSLYFSCLVMRLSWLWKFEIPYLFCTENHCDLTNLKYMYVLRIINMSNYYTCKVDQHSSVILILINDTIKKYCISNQLDNWGPRWKKLKMKSRFKCLMNVVECEAKLQKSFFMQSCYGKVWGSYRYNSILIEFLNLSCTYIIFILWHSFVICVYLVLYVFISFICVYFFWFYFFYTFNFLARLFMLGIFILNNCMLFCWKLGEVFAISILQRLYV